MSEERLDLLSDIQLRGILIQRGFPILPVTETTRNIIIKKLQDQTKINCSKKNYGGSLNKRGDLHTSLWTSSIPVSNNCLVRNLCNAKKKITFARNSLGNKCSKVSCTKPPHKCFSKMYPSSPILGSIDENACTNNNSDYVKSNNTSLNHFFNKRHEYKFSHLGVVNRLLSLREEKFNKKSPLICINNETIDTSKAQLPKESEQYRKGNRVILGNAMNMQTKFNLVIPYILVCIFVAFFFFLTLMYVVITPNFPEISENTTKFSICSGLSETTDFKVSTCIHSNHLTYVLHLVKKLLQLLREREKKHFCSENKQDMEISTHNFITHLYGIAESVKIQEATKNIVAVEYLVKCNPGWKIYTERTTKFTNANTLSEIKFSLKRSHLPLICVLYNKIQKCFIIIGTGTVIALISWISYVTYRYIRVWRSHHHNIVDQFTTDIVNEIIYRASLSEVPEDREVIVNHLRDKLIPLHKRSTLMNSWNEALRILEATDSRVQFGVTNCIGEEFRTIKWIGNARSVTRQAGLTKKWQSPAFDNSNKIINPPTSCLKIRHMFDSTEINHPFLKQIIEDAILEKVGLHCSIQDIQIDMRSCCVYLRCASEADAGIVHNQINGWWFDKRLISIKFLRLHRYLSRFPNPVNELII